MKNTTLIICLIMTLAIFPSSVDAQQVKKRTHEIKFDEMVPCVGEVVHLSGTISVSLTFAGKQLNNVDYSVEIRGTGESTGRTYSPGRIKDHSQNYKVNKNGVGTGDVILTFGIIGRSEANPGNDIFFLAKQIVGLDFRNTNKPTPLIVDFEALKVCVTR
jgi:hypothetical protein